LIVLFLYIPVSLMWSDLFTMSTPSITTVHYPGMAASTLTEGSLAYTSSSSPLAEGVPSSPTLQRAPGVDVSALGSSSGLTGTSPMGLGNAGSAFSPLGGMNTGPAGPSFLERVQQVAAETGYGVKGPAQATIVGPEGTIAFLTPAQSAQAIQQALNQGFYMLGGGIPPVV
jgi:hypothetical protein